MPSVAAWQFDRNRLVDVERLMQSHDALNPGGRGRRGLGHITRSAVLMLCAAWELYIEEALVESVEFLCTRVTGPRELPEIVQREIAKSVRESKHDLKPLEMAGDGWKSVYKEQLTDEVAGLNTPKSTKVEPLYHRFTGLDKLADNWSLGRETIDSFVSIRGDIAHRGRDAEYVTIVDLRNYVSQVTITVHDTDNCLADYLRTVGGKWPWRRRYL